MYGTVATVPCKKAMIKRIFFIFICIFFVGIPGLAHAVTQNAGNQKYTNNTDGFSLAGGTTARTLAVTGGNVTLNGNASGYTYNFPTPFSGTSTTLVGIDETQTLTNKTWAGSIITVPYGGTGAATLTGILKGNGASAMTTVTGTTNYGSRWIDANTLGIGVIYDNGTNVGIGSTSPRGTLDLGPTGKIYGDGSGLTNLSGSGWTTGTGKVYTTTLTDSVGIGTTVPAYKLDVAGSSRIWDTYVNSLYVKKPGGAYQIGLSSGSGGWIYLGSTDVGIYTANSLWMGNGYSVMPYATLGSNLGGPSNYWGTSYINNGYFSGNVGIGVTSPVFKLDINGGTGDANPTSSPTISLQRTSRLEICLEQNYY